ncbi:hypothetical protein HDE_12942 [Halotydeus destructor]|nr:hypothetical protein HDE_12942 [Halotydeus destructor]
MMLYALGVCCILFYLFWIFCFAPPSSGKQVSSEEAFSKPVKRGKFLKFSFDISSTRSTIPDLKVGHLKHRAWILHCLIVEEGVFTLKFNTDLPLNEVVFDYVPPSSGYAANQKWLDSKTLEVFLSASSMLLLDLTNVSAPVQPVYAGIFKKAEASGRIDKLEIEVAPASSFEPPLMPGMQGPSEYQTWHSRPAFFLWLRIQNVLFTINRFNFPGTDGKDLHSVGFLLSRAVDYCLLLSHGEVKRYESVYLMAFDALSLPNRPSGSEQFSLAKETLSHHLFDNCPSGSDVIATHLILRPLFISSKDTRIVDSTRRGLAQLLESHREMTFEITPPEVRRSCLGIFIHDVLMTMPKPSAFLMNQLIQLDRQSRTINNEGLITHDLRELSGMIMSHCVTDYDAALLYPGQISRITDYPEWLLNPSKDHLRLSKLPIFRNKSPTS